MINRAQAGGQQERGDRVATAAGTALRWSAWLVGLFIVVLLAVGAWLLLGSSEPPARVYSPSEQAQLDAEGRYRGLAADARAAAAADPALAERLTAIASDLEAQAAAVSLPRPPAGAPAGKDGATGASPPAPTSGAPTSAAPAPSSTAAPADPVRLLAMLRDSSLRSLSDAVDAEPGPARVLASAGANQWRQAVLLGAALGVGTELPAADAMTADDLGPEQGPSVGPAGSATPSSEPAASGGVASRDAASGPTGAGPARPEDCAGTPLGPAADRQALLGATRAEEQARYGYEVAAALLPDPAPALALSAAHRAAADTAAERLAALCETAAPRRRVTPSDRPSAPIRVPPCANSNRTTPSSMRASSPRSAPPSGPGPSRP
ncbi:hypothetical protein MN0502_12000 [Arthrobacter sp. MN05-02]|nr:hypothetical protein MN0502_12000 [Arthrobacter sp. MN05-02]